MLELSFVPVADLPNTMLMFFLHKCTRSMFRSSLTYINWTVRKSILWQ